MCTVSRGWVEGNEGNKGKEEEEEGGVGGGIRLDPFCHGAGSANLVADAGGAVPCSDEPGGYVVGIEDEDGGSIIGATARREAGGAHGVVAQNTHNEVVGSAVPLPLPVHRAEDDLARRVDADARGTTRRSAGRDEDGGGGGAAVAGAAAGGRRREGRGSVVGGSRCSGECERGGHHNTGVVTLCGVLDVEIVLGVPALAISVDDVFDDGAETSIFGSHGGAKDSGLGGGRGRWSGAGVGAGAGEHDLKRVFVDQGKQFANGLYSCLRVSTNENEMVGALASGPLVATANPIFCHHGMVTKRFFVPNRQGPHRCKVLIYVTGVSSLSRLTVEAVGIGSTTNVSLRYVAHVEISGSLTSQRVPETQGGRKHNHGSAVPLPISTVVGTYIDIDETEKKNLAATGLRCNPTK
ncbi:hypothetical protein B0H19DRAFT_1069168 [Mycena capillaripes]|nr:hypothetical protein B0H19DRAFT_1069168 [Mycena capillaripes]